MSNEEREPYARLPYIESESVRDLFERFRRRRGVVPNLFRVVSHRPPIADVLASALEVIMGPGEVDQRLKELLAVRVSRLNGCEY